MGGAFLDRSAAPGRAELAAALGGRLVLWDRLAGAIESAYGLEPELAWFGKDSGWVVRYRRSGRSLLALLPEPERVRALVVIGPAAYPTASALALEPEVRAALDGAHAYPDGRWLWLDVATEAIADDVVRLVAVKSPPPLRPRARGEAAPGGAA